MLIINRHGPQWFVNTLSGCHQRRCQRFIIAEDASAVMAKRGDDAARQRRQVNHRARAKAPRGIGQRIGQDQPAFRIGIQNLDCLAAMGAQDITRAV